MDLQSLIANGVTIIGGLAGLGATFDNILTTDQTRAKISAFLQRTRSTASANFFAYLALVNETVFQRYFSAPFFSLRYFTTCAVVSVISLLIVLGVQLLAFGLSAFDRITYDGPQLAILAACVLWNVVIDWVSIGQTQIFFEISERQTRLSRAAILIASDFILTINFFTMLYAQPIALGIYVYGAIPQELTISATVRITESKGGEGRTPSPIFGKDRPHFAITFLQELKSGDDEHSAGLVSVVADTPDVSLGDLFRLAGEGFSNAVISSERYVLVQADDGKEERHPAPRPGSQEWKKLVEEEYAEEKEDLRVQIPVFGNPRSLNGAYAVAYQAVDAVQDGFPDDLLQPFMLLPVDRLSAEYHAALYASQLRACGTRRNDVVYWELKSDVSSCEAKLEFSPHDLYHLRSSGQQINSEYSGKQIPLNVFFMTSLSVTALLYAAAFFLFVARQFYQRVIVGISFVEPVFLRGPLAIVGLLLGLFAFGVTLML